jgi:hypothetical protein
VTKVRRFEISKRQRFLVSVVILSFLLFLSEHLFGKSGIYTIFSLALLTDVLLFFATHKDLKGTQTLQVFILPFLYSLSFGLFYFLVPARFLTRIVMTSLYAVGLYSLLLSQNIFVVSSIRTIALLSSARTVSFIMALLSYFFLSNVTFSLHINVFITLLLIFGYSFPLILYSIWTHTLDKHLFSKTLWVGLLATCLVEVSFILWFFPTTPTITALFLTGFFYIVVGLSQIWLQRRLFRNIIWEYIWVAVVVFLVFVFFTIKGV